MSAVGDHLDPSPAPPPRRRWPLRWYFAVLLGALTFGIGFFALWVVYLWRGAAPGTSRRWAFVVLALGLGWASLVIASVTKNHTSPPSVAQAAAPSAPSQFVDADGYTCAKAKVDFKRRCPLNPDFGKTPAQIHAAEVAANKAALAAAAAQAKREKAAAAAHAAYVAHANAWHKGFNQQDDNVYWRWVSGRTCADYVSGVCWHVEVVTRYGCPSYVGVNANQYSGNSVVGSLLDNNGNGIPPKTSALFELDAEGPGNQAGDVKIDCT